LRLLPPASEELAGVVAATAGATAVLAAGAFAAGAGDAGAALVGGPAFPAGAATSSSSLPRSQSKNPISTNCKAKKRDLEGLIFCFLF
jgi:hypothetical protein